MINMGKELEAFEVWQKIFIGSAPFYNGNTLWQKEAWLARAELAAKDDEVIRELAATLQNVGHSYCATEFDPAMPCDCLMQTIARHAERIKQAQDSIEVRT